MKKNVVLVPIALALVAVGYGALAWTLGNLTHQRIDAWAQKANENAGGVLKVIERRSTNGVFFSREDVTFEFDASILDKLDGAKPQTEAVEQDPSDSEPNLSDASLRRVTSEQPRQPMRFTVRNEIAQGPFPEFKSFGIAKISSRLLLDEKTRQHVSKVLGGKDPILVNSLVGFGGSGLIDVVSPAIESDEGEKAVLWQGFSAHIGVGRGMQHISCEGSAPGLAVRSKDRSEIKIGKIGFSCDLNRVFDDLYIGGTSFAIDGISTDFGRGKSPFSMQSVVYTGSASVNGDFIDLNMKLLIRAMKTAEFALDDAEYNVSVKHLYGPTYAALARKLRELSASATLGDPTSSVAMIGAVAEYGPQLLEHAPQVVIERIGFTLPEGEAGVKATIQLKDFTKADLAQGNMSGVLLQKLEANADVWMDEALLQKDWSTESTSTSTTADRIHVIQAQVSSLEQQGYIKRNGERLESHLEYRQGALRANGQPIGPSTE